MITDFLKDSDTYEHEHQARLNKKPLPERTIHTVIGDMRRFGASWNYGHYPLTQDDYKIIEAYYNEKEGMNDDGK